MSLQILLLIHQCSEDILSAFRRRHKRMNLNGKVHPSVDLSFTPCSEVCLCSSMSDCALWYIHAAQWELEPSSKQLLFYTVEGVKYGIACFTDSLAKHRLVKATLHALIWTQREYDTIKNVCILICLSVFVRYLRLVIQNFYIYKQETREIYRE